MRLATLRWTTIAIPILFVIVLIWIEDFVLEPRFGAQVGYLFLFSGVACGAAALSLYVFGTVDAVEGRLRRQNQDLAGINAISQVVSSSLELDEILAQALEKILEVVKTEAGEIFLVDERTQELVLEVHRGSFPDAFQEIRRFAIGEGCPGMVASTGQAVIVDDLAADPYCRRRALVSKGFQTMASVPLRAADRVVGVLTIADRRKKYTPAELELLTAVGNQIGVSVENARLHTRQEEQATYLHTLIENSGHAIITADLQGRILSWNQAAERIYGWGKEEAIGQTLPMVPPHLIPEVHQLLERMNHTREVIYNYETQRLCKDGRLIPVMVTASPVRHQDGEIISLLGVSTDMSEKKALQQEVMQQQRALAILEERERLAQELHDSLGQVLAYMNTQAQATRELLSHKRTDEADAYLKRMVTVAQDSQADVREHILSLQSSALTSQGLIPALREYVQRFCQHNELVCNLDIPDSVARIAFTPAVEVQLMRIIQEALTNVRKHAEARLVLIRFSCDEAKLQVIVEDNGKGFQPAQGTQSNRWRFGLQIMQERAKEFGGSIEIQSAPGQGTRVTVGVPLPQKGRELA